MTKLTRSEKAILVAMAVAQRDPYVDGGYHFNGYYCHFCYATARPKPGGFSCRHKAGCVWAMARRLTRGRTT